MERLRVWHLAAVALLAIALTAPWGNTQVPAVKDFSLSQTGALGPVTFSHEKHLAKNPQCTDCHVQIFQMKVGQTTGGKPMLMADMNAGKLCGTCHNGQKAFAVADCMKCHTVKK